MVFPDSPRVRKNDPTTSHEAADSNNVPLSHKQVLFFLSVQRAAQFEAEQSYHGQLSPSRIRSAFSELETLGKVRRTDQYRLTPSGRRAQVWEIDA